jgi:hypothetical protein
MCKAVRERGKASGQKRLSHYRHQGWRPLWVKSRHRIAAYRCPLYPRKSAISAMTLSPKSIPAVTPPPEITLPSFTTLYLFVCSSDEGDGSMLISEITALVKCSSRIKRMQGPAFVQQKAFAVAANALLPQDQPANST